VPIPTEQALAPPPHTVLGRAEEPVDDVLEADPPAPRRRVWPFALVAVLVPVVLAVVILLMALGGHASRNRTYSADQALDLLRSRGLDFIARKRLDDEVGEVYLLLLDRPGAPAVFMRVHQSREAAELIGGDFVWHNLTFSGAGNPSVINEIRRALR
jgi:hypothetical protein